MIVDYRALVGRTTYCTGVDGHVGIERVFVRLNEGGERERERQCRQPAHKCRCVSLE